MPPGRESNTRYGWKSAVTLLPLWKVPSSSMTTLTDEPAEYRHSVPVFCVTNIELPSVWEMYVSTEVVGMFFVEQVKSPVFGWNTRRLPHPDGSTAATLRAMNGLALVP